MNRHNGPEDAALADRCLTLGLLEFEDRTGGSFRRIVQTPGGISMYYDVRICRPASASGTATRAAIGRATRWSST
jgi:hypothetical protein